MISEFPRVSVRFLPVEPDKARYCWRTESYKEPGTEKFVLKEAHFHIFRKDFMAGARFNVKECLKVDGFDPMKTISSPNEALGKSKRPVPAEPATA
jgi:hypothetical protein